MKNYLTYNTTRGIVLLWCILLVSLGASAQPDAARIDSLTQTLAGDLPDSTRFVTLNEVGGSYFYSAPEQARTYVQEMIDLSQSMGELRKETFAWMAMCNIYTLLDKTDSLEYASRTLIALSEDATDEQILTYRSLGINFLAHVQSTQGRYQEAIATYEQALQNPNMADAAKISILANMGNVYQLMGDLEGALRCHT